MKFSMKQLFLVLSLAVTGAANAGHLAGTDVPDALLVDRNGNEWAWASPCSPVDPSCGGVLVMHHGFVNATAADFLADFTGFQDLHAAFGGGATCASPYFNSGHDHCDGINVFGGNTAVWNAPAGWGPNALAAHSEAFVLRAAVVPEPSGLALAGLALFGLAVSRRKARG